MRRISQLALAAMALGTIGCSIESGRTESAPQGPDPRDVKPEDGAEFEASNLGKAQEPHAQHYVDSSNLWQETQYQMGTDNPNCMDWWVFDRYLSLAPPIGAWSYYSTWDTGHNFATGSKIDGFLAAIPPALGWNTTALKDHNSVVARSTGRCSGRYVFQWDNHDTWGHNNFPWNQYWVVAEIPVHLVPGTTNAACNARAGESVASAAVDLYVCEAPPGQDIWSFGSWCGANSGNWRRFGGARVEGGTYYSLQRRCVVSASYYYTPPDGKVAVSFNLVVKTGVGHGPAPASISIYRVN
ncbi:MAG TPA: hypothetical protein VFZ53_34125 [Polyangiaceae bacterium]